MANPPSSGPRRPSPPGVWKPAARAARAIAAPVERFLAIQAASGIVLLIAAVIALVLANSPLAGAYERLWTTPIGLSLGEHSFVRDLRWWVNDGLMVIFFFVVGLEIRREIYAGELSELRRAALPLAAALGGMLLPALIYTGLNLGRATAGGWGVPMATDIAFAVGVLALLGDRVAPALRILLLSLAVIDDLGAILVIAFFYSDGISLAGVGVTALGVASIWGLQAIGVRSPLLYVPSGLVAWAGSYAAGVHPTIAGVVVGMLTPVRAWLGPQVLADAAEGAAREARALLAKGAGHVHLSPLQEAARESVSPAERLQHALHPWVAFAIMPLFAFANAGVSLGSLQLEGDGMRVFLGVFLGLLVGKAVGVFALSRLAVAAHLAALPRGVRWRDVSIVGLVAGIGFTMALFIAQLAFPPGPALETAKFAILAASAVAGVVGFVAGRGVLGREAGGARTVVEAEGSAEV